MSRIREISQPPQPDSTGSQFGGWNHRFDVDDHALRRDQRTPSLDGKLQKAPVRDGGDGRIRGADVVAVDQVDAILLASLAAK